MKKWLSVAMCLLSFGCRDNDVEIELDRNSVQATPERPPAAKVEQVSIAYDPTLSRWVVVVEPFTVAASGITSGSGWQPTLPTGIGPGIAAQLVSALGRVGNVVVIDHDVYQDNPGKVIAEMRNGELGPFVIRGVVTEFGETADLQSAGESEYGTKTGRVLSMIPVGGVSLAGRIINADKGSRGVRETRRTGMVGFDLQVVDPLTGRVCGSLTAEGSFTAADVVRTKSKFGKTEMSVDYASSALGQAQRAALNSAVCQLHEVLQKVPRDRFVR